MQSIHHNIVLQQRTSPSSHHNTAPALHSSPFSLSSFDPSPHYHSLSPSTAISTIHLPPSPLHHLPIPILIPLPLPPNLQIASRNSEAESYSRPSSTPTALKQTIASPPPLPSTYTTQLRNPFSPGTLVLEKQIISDEGGGGDVSPERKGLSWVG